MTCPRPRTRLAVILLGALLCGCTGDSEQLQVTVRLDPYGIAPLAAVIEVSGIDAAAVQRTRFVLAGLDGEDLDQEFDPQDRALQTNFADPQWDAGRTYIPVLGLYPGHKNRIRVEVTTADHIYDRELIIDTRPLDASLPTIKVIKRDTSRMEPGWNLAGFSAYNGQLLSRPLIYDHFGRIRWVLLLDQAISPGHITPFQRLKNGNLCFGLAGYVYEYNMLGREVNRWVLPPDYQQHHDVFEMSSGNLLVAAYKKGMTIIPASGPPKKGATDHVLELERKTGAIVNVWDLREYLDVDRYTLIDTSDSTDFFHLNAVVHSAADDAIIVSGKNQGLVKITRGGAAGDTPNKNKQLRWILAPHLGWGRGGYDGSGIDLAPYLLTATDDSGSRLPAAVQDGTQSTAEFDWVYHQHAPLLLDNGNLFIFDNGANRGLGHYVGDPYSRGVEFRVVDDPSGVGGTIRQVWQYGKERGPDLYDPAISDVDVGSVTGNRFILPGSYTVGADGTTGGAARMVEVTYPKKDVVFEAHIYLKGKEPFGDEICYRQERMTLFPSPR
jgi:arylsulfate sulfotransferase